MTGLGWNAAAIVPTPSARCCTKKGASARGDRFRPGLHDIELLIEAVLRPLHVHGLGMARLVAVVPLDLDRIVGEGEHVLVGEAEPLAIGLRGRHVARGLARTALDVHHLDLLAAEGAAPHGARSALERRLGYHELVRIDHALHDVLAEPVGGVHEHHVAESCLSVEREHDATRGEIRAHHPHDADRERNFEVIESLIEAVMDCTIGEQAREAALAGIEQSLLAMNVEVAVLLAGKARGRQVFGGGRAAYRKARVSSPSEAFLPPTSGTSWRPSVS